jgi:2-keto-4-pentenoate hydratase
MSENDADLVARLASSLFVAEAERRPIDPLTDAYPDLSVTDAYRIQQTNVERRVSAGETVIGHKIGLTAKAMQDLFNVDEPDYGHLLNTMNHEQSQPLDLGELIDPQIEVEPAFVLGKPLAGPGVTKAEALAATDYVAVCFEVIDSRIVDWRIKLQDTVADNGSSARVVLGSQRTRPDDDALGNSHTVLEVDGVEVETGNTSAILGHPAVSVAWLVNKLAEFDVELQAGDIVLPGTCTRCYRIGGHRRIAGRIDGLGSVALELAGAPTVTNPHSR